MRITRIPAQQEQCKTRIAVYCRVSTKKEEQEDSLKTQRETYISLISRRPDWELVGVYADRLSGLIAQKRPEFMKMIDEALKGEIDRILCKSVSRFSRNVAECKKYIDMLRLKNVTVEFEKEHLSTDDPSSSFIFSLMSAIAENESRSISENIKWGQRERVKRGEFNLGNNRILGYDTVNRKLVPNKDAWIIRTIFQQYAEGATLQSIQQNLLKMGVVSKTEKPLSVNGICYKLRNEAYRGDKLLQKKPPRNFITKMPDQNTEYVSNYLKDDHEAIVDDATWRAVQARISKNMRVAKTSGSQGKETCRTDGKNQNG